jgi:hypothetical protein
MKALAICCVQCKTHLSVCRDRGCWCHIEQAAIAREQDKRGGPPHRDPVGEQAVGRVNAQRKKRKRKGG